MKTIRRTASRCLALAATVATAVGLAAPAAAADIPMKATPDPVVRPLWAGYYIGLHFGAGWSTSRGTDGVIIPTPTFPYDELRAWGLVVGGQVGRNWQHGPVVMGVELDGSWTAIGGGSNTSPIPAVQGTAFDIQAMATLTGRLGFAMGPWLTYLKGGGAWVHIKYVPRNVAVPPTFHSNEFGVVGGIGTEVSFLRNVSAKIEYNFIYVPEQSDLPLIWHGAPTHIHHFIHLVKGGVNVRFGG